MGVNIALALQRNGYDVRIIDRKGGLRRNICRQLPGAFALTDILPLGNAIHHEKSPQMGA